MGLSSFFKPRRNTNSQVRARRTVYRENDGDEESVLQQRARWRLIGASILVVMSIIILPKILDVAPPPASFPEVKIHSQHPNDISASSSVADPGNASVSVPQPSTALPSAVPAEASLSEGEQLVSQPAIASTSHRSQVNHQNASQSSAGAGKIFLKAGAFASETRAYNWLAKLKAAKLPAYVNHKKMAEGERYLLRVGPFVDHASAQTAQKKLQNMGLPSIITEGT